MSATIIDFPRAVELAHVSLDRNILRANAGDPLATVCVEALSRYPGDSKIAGAARMCLEALDSTAYPTDVEAPSDVEPKGAA